jgi:programmed cell death 6-interacting protein
MSSKSESRPEPAVCPETNTPASDISMPPLSALSLNPPQSPPSQAYQTPNPASYYTQSPPQPARQSIHQPPPVAPQIQSWADNIEQQQPRPMPPVAPVANMQGAWTPDMGIRFTGLPPAGGNDNGAQGGRQGGGKPSARGTWEPSTGIRFG